MNLKEEITFETTADHFPDEGGIVSVDVKVKLNVVDNKIFYHVIKMRMEKKNFVCGILLLKYTGVFSHRYNYTFQYEKKDYYIDIQI